MEADRSMDTFGRHVIAELDGCAVPALRSTGEMRAALREAALAAGATILADEFFQFNNGGVSGFVLLAESHISIHTWPEHAYAAVDIYTCGDHTDPEYACSYLGARLGNARLRVTVLERGRVDGHGGHEHVVVRRRPAKERGVAPTARRPAIAPAHVA
jgi:S-adenosylmethionine decarboxylase